MDLSVYYQNARGLRTKLNTFRLNMMTCVNDVVCITETNLIESIADAEINNNGEFKLFRRDRDYTLTGSSKGGGCLIAVRKGLQASRVYIIRDEIRPTRGLMDKNCMW